jgi:predicted secreted hydrolase
MRKLIVIAVVLALMVLLVACGCGEQEAEEVTEPTQLDQTREITFPEDHFPHEDVLTEWWYFTGLLQSEEGQRFAYFYTWFLSEGETMILMNLVDIQAGESAFVEFLDTLGETTIAEESLDLDIGGTWRIEYLDNGDFYVTGQGENADLELTFRPQKDNVLNGDNGYMEMSTGGTSAYYSCTRMSASGNISFEGREIEVEGSSWLDRQWGNWKGDAAETYDWFSIRFDDNTELMIYSFRDTETGEVLAQYNCGTYVDEEGNAVNLTDFNVDPLGREWRSEKTGETYPLKWQVEVPSLEIDITIDALVEDQLIIDSLGGTFWEGICEVQGSKTGSCYLEMDGYNP